MSIAEFINGIPKVELHLHIEGSFEPELMFEIAGRNNVSIPFASVDEVKAAYKFNNLQEFLDIYYAGAGVLLHENDFYDLTYAYLKKIHSQGVVHTEIFFDPQTHTDRGVSFETVITGIHNALEDGLLDFGISYKLIMSYLRHLSEESAFNTLQQSLPYKNWITAVGLDSSEVGNPPSKFERVFAQSREEGFLTVAHAGEEGPSEYIHEALNLLKVSRIDHGNRCLDDDALVDKLSRLKMPLTLCPLSNLELKVIDDMKKYPLRKMMSRGLKVTLNSDDPAYFGGYMNENLHAVNEALQLTKEEVITLSKNAVDASFLNGDEKKELMSMIDTYALSN